MTAPQKKALRARMIAFLATKEFDMSAYEADGSKELELTPEMNAALLDEADKTAELTAKNETLTGELETEKAAVVTAKNATKVAKTATTEAKAATKVATDATAVIEGKMAAVVTDVDKHITKLNINLEANTPDEGSEEIPPHTTAQKMAAVYEKATVGSVEVKHPFASSDDDLGDGQKRKIYAHQKRAITESNALPKPKNVQ